MKKLKDKKIEKKHVVIFALLLVALILVVVFLYNNQKTKILNITREDRIYWHNYFSDENRIRMTDVEFDNINQLNVNDFVSLAEDLYILKPISECLTENCPFHPYYVNWLNENRDKYPKDEDIKISTDMDYTLTFDKNFIDDITLKNVGKKYNHNNADNFNSQYGVYYRGSGIGGIGSYTEVKTLYHLDGYRKIGLNKVELEIYEVAVTAKYDEEKDTFVDREKFDAIKNDIWSGVSFAQVAIQNPEYEYSYRKNRIVLKEVGDNKYYYVSNNIIEGWQEVK